MISVGGISTSAISASPDEKAHIALEGSILPPDAKKALKDFINETFQSLWNTLEELVNIDPPLHLYEYWELFVEIIKQIM